MRIPSLVDRIQGRDVLDFGAGEGEQAIALAEAGARRVTGVEIQPRLIQMARHLARTHGVDDRVEFTTELDAGARFDTIISQDAFEHFADPEAVLNTMRAHLRPGGVILVTFGPLWYAPFGAHMYHWSPIPWVHLLFPERAVMRARARFSPDGATRYEECTGGLNRMTLKRFEGLVRDSRLLVEHWAVDYVRGHDVMGRIPVLRELFANNIACVLKCSDHDYIHHHSREP